MDTFMESEKYLFTSESVTEGHPDKLCDQVSDAVLDECLRQDPRSRVACESATKTGFVMLLGEITTNAVLNYDDLVRGVVLGIGYDHTDKIRWPHLRSPFGPFQANPRNCPGVDKAGEQER